MISRERGRRSLFSEMGWTCMAKIIIELTSRGPKFVYLALPRRISHIKYEYDHLMKSNFSSMELPRKFD